jgi:hypothetical protein
MKTRILAFAAVCLVSAPHAAAEKIIRIAVKETASYDQALTCFQYYAIAQEVSEKVIKDKDLPQDVARQQTVRGQIAVALKAAWTQRIVKMKGAKTEDQVNADIAKITKPMVATTNAALNGDEAAAKKHNAVETQCKTHESVAEVDAPPPKPANPG